jgi:hypothetical protein
MIRSDSQAEAKRRLIMHVLRKSDRPLNAKEISHRVAGEFHIHMNTAEIGANMGMLRVAEKVLKVSCFMGMFKVGRQRYPNMINHWFSADRGKKYGFDFKRKMMRANRLRYESTLPLEKRRRKRPISDDMRQMIEDIAR